MADVASIGIGGDPTGDGIITATELYLFVRDRVEKLTGEVKPQHPNLFPMAEHRDGEFIFINPRRNFDPSQLPSDPNRNPYKALEAYEMEDAKLFFGRNRSIREILEQLLAEDVNILFVTGTSGSGKSSLVKAGVFPVLKRRDGYGNFLILRPGDLLPAAVVGDEQSATPWQVLESALSSDQKTILLIDQYEELFTHPEKDQLQGIILALVNLAKEHNRKIIFTMRSDFEWQLKISPLGQYWEKQRIYRIPPMNLDELRDAMTVPARMYMYQFKDEDIPAEEDTGEKLITTILDEVSHAPGALPLLSFTMYELFRLTRQANQRTLSLRRFTNQLGGVEGALSRRAEMVYENLPDDAHRTLMKHIVLRMVQLNDGSYGRRQVWLSHPGMGGLNELDFPIDEDDEMVRTILRRLRTAHLIVRGGEDVNQDFIEPAHDSFINFWPKCLQWINEIGQDNLLLQRSLWQSVLDEDRQKRDTNVKLPGLSRASNDKDLATSLSFTWEFNPKLEELTRSVLDPSGSWLRYPYLKSIDDFAPLIWGDAIPEAQMVKLASLDPPQVQRNTLLNSVILAGGRSSNDLNDAIRGQMNNWLNVAERQFIRRSWERRTGRIAQLTQERNRAMSNLFAFRAEAEPDVTIAFRMAEFAIRIDPENPKAMEQLLERYYFSDHPFHTTLIGPAGIVEDLCFAPDGELVASAADSKIWLWEVSTGREAATLVSGDVKRLRFTPDGSRLISGSNSDNASIRIWDLQSGRELVDLMITGAHTKRIQDMDLSPDGKLLATITTGENDDPDAFVLKLWDITNGSLIRAWDLAHREIHRQWEESGKPRLENVIYAGEGTPFGHRSHPEFVRFNGDGTLLITSEGRNSDFLVWKVADGRVLFRLSGQGGSTTLNDFYRDGRYILTVAHDNSIRKWDLTTGLEVESARIWEYGDGYFNGLALHPNQREAAVAMGTGFNHYDLNHRNKQLEFKARAHQDSVRRIDYSPDGAKIATASYRIIRLWDRLAKDWKKKTHNLVRITENTDENSEINTVCWHPDGSHFISASRDNSLQRWRINSDQADLLGRFTEPEAAPLKSAFYNTSGDRILLARGRAVQIFDPADPKVDHFEYEHNAMVNLAIYSPDGNKVLSCDQDGGICLWDIAEKEFLISERAHEHPVRAIAFPASRSDLFATADSHDNIKLWFFDTERSAWKITPFNAVLFGVNYLSFSADGAKLLATGGERFRMFDISGERPVEEMVLAHEHQVWQAFYAFNETKIISVAENGKIKVWDAVTGDQLYQISHTGRLNAPRWSHLHPHRAQLLVATNVDAALYWLDPSELIREAEQNINISQLTREQIEQFGLGNYLGYANLIDEQDDIQPLINSGNEALLYSFAEYFEFKGWQRDNLQVRRRYFEKAQRLYNEASRIAFLHTPASYREILDKYRNSWLRQTTGQ